MACTARTAIVRKAPPGRCHRRILTSGARQHRCSAGQDRRGPCGCWMSRSCCVSRQAGRNWTGRCTLRHGPERIESQWWEAPGVARDYYHATDVHGIAVWVFRERAAAASLVPAWSVRMSTPRLPTRSCTASPTSPFCAGPRDRRSWCSGRSSWATARSPSPMSVRWRAWCARIWRSRIPARQALQLLIGAEFTLTCGLKFVALATNRHGYARLCALITHGRRAAPKGSYQLTRADCAAAS